MEKSNTEVNEMTVEEKKAAALKAKEDAKLKANEQKEKDKADKQQALVNEAGQHYTNLTSVVSAVKGAVDALSPESTLEQVQSVVDSTADQVKDGKALVKDIKALSRKAKDNQALKDAVTSAEALLTDLTNAVTPLKTKVSDAKKAAKDAEKAEERRQREEEKAKNAMPKKNDVTRPRPDTACGKAWDLMDRLTAKLNQPAPVSLVLQAAEKEGLVHDTVKTQYARWKKFNGIEGRVQMPLPEGILD